MVATQVGVRPGARAPERVVGDRGRTIEHRDILAVGLETLVGAGPDAGATRNLAVAVVAPPARPVALVLDALALGTEIGDLRKRAVAAVAAVEERDLDRLFGDVRDVAEMRPLGGPVHAASGPEAA